MRERIAFSSTINSLKIKLDDKGNGVGAENDSGVSTRDQSDNQNAANGLTQNIRAKLAAQDPEKAQADQNVGSQKPETD